MCSMIVNLAGGQLNNKKCSMIFKYEVCFTFDQFVSFHLNLVCFVGQLFGFFRFIFLFRRRRSHFRFKLKTEPNL